MGSKGAAKGAKPLERLGGNNHRSRPADTVLDYAGAGPGTIVSGRPEAGWGAAFRRDFTEGYRRRWQQPLSSDPRSGAQASLHSGRRQDGAVRERALAQDRT